MEEASLPKSLVSLNSPLPGDVAAAAVPRSLSLSLCSMIGRGRDWARPAWGAAGVLKCCCIILSLPLVVSSDSGSLRACGELDRLR